MLATIGSVGGVAGGFAASAWGGLKKRRVYGVLIPLIASGLALSLYGMSKWLYVTAAAAFFFEGLIPLMNSHSQAIWQSQVPRELQGRVFSVRRLIAQFSWPLSTLVMGGLASKFDPGIIIAALGVMLAVWCVIGLFNLVS